MSDSAKFGIIAAPGGFGNHIRWLLLLDPMFSLKCFDVNTPDEKINFLKLQVYSPQRSWHNWLTTEWKFRDAINSLISLSHGGDLRWKEMANNANDKTLLCTVDADLAYRNYVKFNSNLNSTDADKWKNYIGGAFSQQGFKYYMDQFRCYNQCCVISSDLFFQEDLDRTLYEHIINFFNLSNQFDLAADIHRVWYKLQIHAEQEIIDTLSKLFKIQR